MLIIQRRLVGWIAYPPELDAKLDTVSKAIDAFKEAVEKAGFGVELEIYEAQVKH